jgi:hypothetical protein
MEMALREERFTVKRTSIQKKVSLKISK